MNPKQKVYSLIMKLLDKNSLTGLYEEVKVMKKECLLIENTCNEYQYRKRT